VVLWIAVIVAAGCFGQQVDESAVILVIAVRFGKRDSASKDNMAAEARKLFCDSLELKPRR
jgi:hypothetical protein